MEIRLTIFNPIVNFQLKLYHLCLLFTLHRNVQLPTSRIMSYAEYIISKKQNT